MEMQFLFKMRPDMSSKSGKGVITFLDFGGYKGYFAL
jgi:hypothetical protein